MKYLAATLVVLALALTTQGAPQCLWGPSYWCQSMDSAQLCSRVQYCQQNVWKNRVKTVEVSGVISCEVCKIAVGLIDKIIDKNSTEAEAEKVAEGICNVFGSLKTECDDLIEQYFPMIWQMLINEISPDVICDALKLCSSSRKQTAAVSGAVGCDVCKIVVGFADKYIAKNTTEAEAEKVVEGFCSILGALEAECDDLIKEYFPQIWAMLINEVSPDVICDALKLCSSSRKQTPPQSRVQSAVGCEICKEIATILDALLSRNSTEEDAEKVVQKVCGYLGGLAGECDSLVKEYFPMIWKLLEAELDPDTICAAIGLCTSSKKQVGPVAPRDDLCDLCHLVAIYLKNFVDNNSTEANVENELKQLCSVLGSLEAECDALVNMYFPDIWNYVKDDVDSGKLCEQLGLCNSTATKVLAAAPPTPLAKPTRDLVNTCQICEYLVKNFLKPIIDRNGTEAEAETVLKGVCEVLKIFSKNLSAECDEISSELPLIWPVIKSLVDEGKLCPLLNVCSSAKVQLKAKAPDGFITCEVCKLVVSELTKYIADNKTEEEAENALKDFCSDLESLSSECTDLVGKYFPLIWNLMLKGVDEVCTVIGLCSSETAPKKQEFPGVCELCEFVVKELFSSITKSSTEAEIADALAKVCDVAPSKFRADCEAFIEKYTPEIIKLVLDGVGPNVLCTMLGLCVGEKPKPAATSEVTCDVCKMVLTELKAVVGASTTKATVEAALDKVCGYLPTALTAECTAFVNEYAGEVIELVDDEIDPDKLCKLLKLCPSTLRQLPSLPFFKAPRRML